jgi:bifunctional DNA-binding transcriptional regulator/antitoxin component of YhaV-PrlF toxin-antitoxin module
MATATVTSRTQITLPVDVRRSLGVDTGDRVAFGEVAPGRYEAVAATLPATALKGCARTTTFDRMARRG